MKAALSVDVLPDELKGKSEAELKFILKNMTSTIRSQHQRLQELQQGGRQPQGGKEKEPEEKEEKKPSKPLEERILEDPEGVIAEVVQRRYGGVISQLDSRTARSELAAARAEIDDFGEYENEVLDLLKEAGQPATYENLVGAYTMAVGNRVVEERRQGRQKQLGMENGGGSNPDEDTKPKIQLSDLEKEMAQAHGMTEEQWVQARDGDITSQIRVPTGKREK